jgi:hypothetical protein
VIALSRLGFIGAFGLEQLQLEAARTGWPGDVIELKRTRPGVLQRR